MLNRQQSRDADRFAIEKLGIPGIALMENAGRGCAETLLALDPGDGVAICCGSGNNGGDGFVIARHLHNAAVRTKVILFSPPQKYGGDARTNLRIIERLKIPIVEFDAQWNDEQLTVQFQRQGRFETTWIVDAILGTGVAGPLRAPLDRVVRAINAMQMKRLAVDIPTGMDCDTGDVNPIAVRADVTCTFVDQKTGFANPAAWPFVGHIKVVGIGAPRATIEQR